MAYAKHLSNTSVIALSTLTAASLFLHGMQVEKLHRTSLTLPLAVGTYRAMEGSMDLTEIAHTHVERNSVSDAVQHLSSPDTSRVLPREDSRKHVLAKKVSKGTHAFDGYQLPLKS